MNRRIIVILIVAILVLSSIGGLLFFAVRKQKQPNVPVITGPLIKKVLDESVIAPAASLDNSAVWYFNSEGRLFRVNTDGSGLSEFPLPSLTTGKLKQALWSKSGTDFIAVTGSVVDELKFYYNSSKKTYTSLPANIQSLDWMPDGQRVLYIWKPSDNSSPKLAIANADGTGYRSIKDVYWPDLKVLAGPDGKTALLVRSDIQGDINKIYFIDLATGVFGTPIDQGKNISAAWISSNRFIFTRSTAEAYPKVLLYDYLIKGSLDLNINTTLDKIVVDKEGKFLYAAVPSKDGSGDTFIKLDLNNLKQETYFKPSTNVQAVGLIMIGNTIYFTDAQDGKFYTISK